MRAVMMELKGLKGSSAMLYHYGEYLVANLCFARGRFGVRNDKRVKARSKAAVGILARQIQIALDGDLADPTRLPELRAAMELLVKD